MEPLKDVQHSRCPNAYIQHSKVLFEKIRVSSLLSKKYTDYTDMFWLACPQMPFMIVVHFPGEKVVPPFGGHQICSQRPRPDPPPKKLRAADDFW